MTLPLALALVATLQGSPAGGTPPPADPPTPLAAGVAAMPGTPSAVLGGLEARSSAEAAPAVAPPAAVPLGVRAALGGWLRDDLGRSRRVLLHEGGRLAGWARSLAPEILAWAALALLAGALAFRLLFRSREGRASFPGPVDEPLALEMARRVVECGMQGGDAVREVGLARDGLELVRTLSVVQPAHRRRSRAPWATPPSTRMVERLFDGARGPATPSAGPTAVASPVYRRPR